MTLPQGHSPHSGGNNYFPKQGTHGGSQAGHKEPSLADACVPSIILDTHSAQHKVNCHFTCTQHLICKKERWVKFLTHETVGMGILSARPRIVCKENLRNVLKSQQSGKGGHEMRGWEPTTCRVLSFPHGAGLLQSSCLCLYPGSKQSINTMQSSEKSSEYL